MRQGDLATAIRGLLAAGLALALLAAPTAARGGEPLFVVDVNDGFAVGSDHKLPRLIENLINQEGAFSEILSDIVDRDSPECRFTFARPAVERRNLHQPVRVSSVRSTLAG